LREGKRSEALLTFDIRSLVSYTRSSVLALLHRPDVWLFTLFLAIVYPIADYFFYSRLKTALQVYLWNILAAWALTAATVVLIFRNNLTLSGFGQNLGTYPRTLIVIAALVLLVLILSVINKRQKRKLSREKAVKLTENVRKLLPSTGTERIVCVLVAFTAGFCEEFLYRGWLLNLTGAACGSIWLGLLISSIFFGFAHLYQGRRGVIGTGIGGLVFGLVYIASRSLLPGQLLHTFLDLYNLLALSKLATRRESSSPAADSH